MSSACFRVRVDEPDCTVWTGRLAFAAARDVARVHRNQGLPALCVYNAERIDRLVEELFVVAPPEDVGLMKARGVVCKYVKVWRDPFNVPDQAELVTSKEQLAAVLGIAPESVIENPPPLAVRLASAVAELARRLGLVPRGKEPS